jgi:hypothetical protein
MPSSLYGMLSRWSDELGSNKTVAAMVIFNENAPFSLFLFAI